MKKSKKIQIRLRLDKIEILQVSPGFYEVSYDCRVVGTLIRRKRYFFLQNDPSPWVRLDLAAIHAVTLAENFLRKKT